MTENAQTKGYDFAYLKETVGTPLADALAQAALIQPDDPVEFVGNFLLQHVENENQQYNAMTAMNIQCAMDAKREEQAKHKNDALAYKIEEAEIEKIAEDRTADVLLNSESLKALTTLVFSKIISSTGAAGVYIGRKVPGADDVEYIHWFAASDSSSCVLDKWVSEEDGISFDVFKEVEVENPEPDEDGNIPPPRIPDYILVDNVVREPRMKFFGVPKLGSYLVRAISYKTYLHQDVLEEIEPGAINTKEESLVIAADTLGNSKKFSKKSIENFMKWTTIFGESIEALEKRVFLQEVSGKRKEIESIPFLKETIAKRNDENEEAIKTELEAIEEDAEKEIKLAEMKLRLMTEIVVSFMDEIDSLSQYQIPYKDAVLKTLVAALTVLGHPKAELYNPVTSKPSWDKIQLLLEKSTLLSLIEAFNPDVPVFQAKSILEELSFEEVDQAQPIVGCIFKWTESAIAASDAISQAALAAEQAMEEAEN